MAAEWYCRIMGDEWGPMSSMELIAVARWGRLSRDDTVRKGTDGNWVRAELVRGLFNSPPVAQTVSSDRLVAAARAAAPARRSVRKRVPTRYWVMAGRKLAGPFSSRELRRMAEQGSLKPADRISKDRSHWTPAAEVKGLVFGGASEAAARTSVRSVVWLEKPLASADVRSPGYVSA